MAVAAAAYNELVGSPSLMQPGLLTAAKTYADNLRPSPWPTPTTK